MNDLKSMSMLLAAEFSDCEKTLQTSVMHELVSRSLRLTSCSHSQNPRCGPHLGMARADRKLSHDLLSLISPKHAGTSVNDDSDDENSEVDKRELEHTQRNGLSNSEGAWCWKEDCAGKIYKPVA